MALADLVGETLRSLQAQGFTDWEAIVVDDGAPDDVEAALRPFAGDPRIRLLKTDNRGVAIARNRAIAHARAPLIALLDGDDLYEPDYLGDHGARDRGGRRARLRLVATPSISATIRAPAGAFSEFSSQVPPITLARVLRREFNVFTACILRKAAFDAVGGYDGTLRAAEDFDLWLRLLEAGWRGDYVPRPLARYRRRAGSLSRQTATLMTRGRARLPERRRAPG